MLNGRLYRSACVPLVLALVVVAFSLGGRPAPVTSGLAPDAFEGKRAAVTLGEMAARWPRRRPGSAGDEGAARFVAGHFATASAQGGPQGGQASGAQSTFGVTERRLSASTIDGRRSLTTVIAQRPGDSERQIVLLAHRDAAAPHSRAELSGTAALLELARVLSQRVTTHSLTLVSTSGGSGGDAGAVDLARRLGGPVDGAIVLGDLAGVDAHKPFVMPWSDAPGSAPVGLQRTVGDAIAAEVGTGAGGDGLLSQFVHLALPFATGEQGVLNAAGLPAVTVQVSGERGPSPGEPVSTERMQNFGRAVLRAVAAIDADRRPAGPPEQVMVVVRQIVPIWAMRLLVAAALLPALVATLDAFARVRRRREAVGPWLGWAVACALPFLACALAAALLGRVGLLPALPAPPPPGVLALRGSLLAGVIACSLVLALAWVAWPRLARRLVAGAPPGSAAAGVAVLAVLEAVAVASWVRDPYTALLLVPAVNLWLLVAAPDLRPPRAAAMALVVAGVTAPAAVVAVHAHQLGMNPAQAAWTALLLVSGGHIGALGVALWSLALGCLVGAALLALRGQAARAPLGPVTVRGPLGYAGPGSLGGTESALRR